MYSKNTKTTIASRTRNNISSKKVTILLGCSNPSKTLYTSNNNAAITPATKLDIKNINCS
ncbi:hypothetical protein BJV85_000692 [Clostridium acetobutylicum]|nr:hypothetical protein [Clostridium acetobutylicum]NSA91846.1 hypothetical protein [Clostridium acetobutylicum]